jgi:pyridoxal phosphate enzyme (YggS family)
MGQALEAALGAVRARMGEAANRAGRDPREVLLVAVTKGVHVEVVERARALGIEDFGENYANALAGKAMVVPATWHFLGKIQYGTVPRVAVHADVVHSAEPGRGLHRLARRAVDAGREVRCLAQVDFTGSRQGVGPEAIESFLSAVQDTGGIRVVGLMTMPPWTGEAEGARPYFARLRAIRERLRPRWDDIGELSMGMSADFDVAIEEGATMVRIGTALFGKRALGR